MTVAAKGGGSENKAKFANLDPAASVPDWVVQTVETLGAGWCPPGLLGIGVGGSAEKAMCMAKEALFEPIDMSELLRRGPSSKLEEMRIEIYDRVNALGVGAQGLGGLTTVVDVKIRSFPCHAASKPVGLIPQCAADRHVTFSLDGSGPAQLTPPDLSLWPDLSMGDQAKAARRVNLDALTRPDVATWRAGEALLLSGRMLTGRDAAHQRLVSMIEAGEPLPVDLRDRAIYYVGPVGAAPGEVVGPAGPTTSIRMDGFTDAVLSATGLLVMIGKAERGPAAIDAIGATAPLISLRSVGGLSRLEGDQVRPRSRLRRSRDGGDLRIRSGRHAGHSRSGRKRRIDPPHRPLAMATSGVHAIGASDGRRSLADPLKIEHPIAICFYQCRTELLRCARQFIADCRRAPACPLDRFRGTTAAPCMRRIRKSQNPLSSP